MGYHIYAIGKAIRALFADRVTYKLLSTLAAKYLCVPTTSVPSERVFICTGNIINSKRACIHPENVNMLCFLHNNLYLSIVVLTLL